MAGLEKNKVYRAVIEGYSSEGLGIARIDGQVVFVHRAVRGEVCDILVLKVLKNAAFGKVVAIETPSEHRREPDCPYYGKCGGCDFRHMDYEEELVAKRQRVQDALTRLGGSSVEVEEIIGADEPLRYRNKSQYPISADGRVGFYRARTHEVVETEGCFIQKREADAAAEAVRQYIRRFSVPGYDEKTGKGLLRHLYVRTNAKGESLICLLVNGRKLPHEAELVAMLREAVPQTVGVVLGENTRRGNTILGEKYRTLWGEDTLLDTLCGLTFRLSVPSFYQVNRHQAEKLYNRAVDYARLTGSELVLDLYCGAGTITQVMAQKAGKVIGAEIVPEAIADAKVNAQRNGVENVEFFCGDASDIAQELQNRGLRPDVICVDPPRKGLAPEVVEAAAAMNPQRIVYVSCDPATMGRDVKRFAALGYEVTHATAVDLFPGTANIETVCLLEKTEKNNHILEGFMEIMLHQDLSVQQLSTDDTLSETQYRDIARLIYDTDKWIFPALFEGNDNPRESAADVISHVLKNGTDRMYNKNNLFVCFKGSHIIGVILWCFEKITWNYEDFIRSAAEVGVQLFHHNVADVNNAFWREGNTSNQQSLTNTITLINVCVNNSYRGHGVGTFMLNKFVSIYGSKKMELCVLKHNHVALRLYTANGFRPYCEYLGFSQTPDKPMCYGMKRQAHQEDAL